MGADLKIHIWNKMKLDEDVFKVFFHNVLGNKYGCGIFGGWTIGEQNKQEEIIKKKYGKETYELIAETPSYYCGETSTLKATLFDDDSFLYGMGGYLDLMGNGFREITNEFIKEARELDPKLADFLSKYRGKTAFCVSW